MTTSHLLKELKIGPNNHHEESDQENILAVEIRH